jgi:hypothetical protein
VPIAGTIVIRIAAASRSSGGRLVSIADQFGKWSMFEVFVAALLSVALRLGLVPNADLHYGAYLLAGSVVLSVIASQLLSTGPDSRPIRSGAATLTIGAIIGAIAMALLIGILNPELLSCVSFGAGADAR